MPKMTSSQPPQMVVSDSGIDQILASHLRHDTAHETECVGHPHLPLPLGAYSSTRHSGIGHTGARAAHETSDDWRLHLPGGQVQQLVASKGFVRMAYDNKMLHDPDAGAKVRAMLRKGLGITDVSQHAKTVSVLDNILSYPDAHTYRAPSGNSIPRICW